MTTLFNVKLFDGATNSVERHARIALGNISKEDRDAFVNGMAVYLPSIGKTIQRG